MITHEQALLLHIEDISYDERYAKYQQLERDGLVLDVQQGWPMTDTGREALAEYDRKWVMVEQSTLQSLCDMLLARDPLLGASILHPTLAAAQSALRGEQTKPEPPAEWTNPENGDRWLRAREHGCLVQIAIDYAEHWSPPDKGCNNWWGMQGWTDNASIVEICQKAHTILWPELSKESKT